MEQIYTKTGDTGQTSLRGGERVTKDDPRIETNGQIDHLNALLAVVRASLKESDDPENTGLLLSVQRELMVVMSHIATPEGQVNPKPLHADDLTRQMEQAIDRLAAIKPTGFVLPGKDLTTAFTHVARTQARTVERRLWTLSRQYPVDSGVLKMMNRLSDFLFALAL